MNTPKLTLRGYQPSDLSSVQKLMAAHFMNEDVIKRGQIFDWIALHNPYTNGETNYLVIEDGEKIVAYEGRMPVEIMINGEREKGYFFHDTLVHPEYRRKGLGLTLVNNIKKTWEDKTDTFAVGVWMNQFTHEMMRRRGYYELYANYFIKPLNIESSLAKMIKTQAGARLAAAPFNGLTSTYDYAARTFSGRNISISPVSRFDGRFDEFADAVSKKFSMVVVRSSRYLNWKYVDRPYAGYTNIAAEREGRLAGYAVLLPTVIDNLKVGVIVDILADPDDAGAIGALCEASTRFFRRAKADFIVCVLTNENFIRIFQRHFFLKRHKTAPPMIANMDKHGDQEILRDISRWFFTCGDSDGFVWQ
jgi:GNAT superfamily N-acetyltransferase